MSKATNVTPSEETYQSKEGYDKGSYYINLFCVECETNLGKIYKTTSKGKFLQSNFKEMEEFKELFCFFGDCILSYGLDSGEFKTINETNLVTLKSLQEKLIQIQGVLLNYQDTVDQQKENQIKLEKEILNLKYQLKEQEKYIQQFTEIMKGQSKLIQEISKKL